MLSEALLCFGASSTSIDEQDSYVQNEEVDSLELSFYILFLTLDSKV